jgi:LPXTG-motif cell wall-anchored protein
MAVSLRRRSTGVLALAMAGGLSLAAAAPAGAAANTAPAYYQGVTSANVLSVALNLPVALPSVPQHLAVNLIGVTGNAVHNTLSTVADKTASTSTATLASGNLVEALPAQLGLSKTIKASLDGAQSASSDALSVTSAQTDGLLSLNVGPLRAAVSQLNNSASAELLNADVLNLGALLGAKTNGATTTLVKAVQDNVSSIQTQVQSQLDNVVNQVNSAVNTVAPNTPASQTLAQVQAAVQTVQDKVNTVLNQVLNTGNTSVLKVQTLTASQNIAPAGSAAKATADTVLANLDLLSGLVTVKGFESHAMAIANGKAGGAAATFSGHKPIVAVGTPVLTAALDENGLSLSNVAGLPSSVSDQVNGALAQLQTVLNTVLGTLGVHLTYTPGHVDKVDTVGGKYAAATGPEYDVTVANPTDASNAIAVVGLGHGTTASVSAAQATRHVQLSNPQQGKLPHTGANLPIIAGGGLAFLLGAAYLRRRVMA